MTQLNKNDSVKNSVLSTYWFNNYDIDIASGSILKPILFWCCSGVVRVSFQKSAFLRTTSEQHPKESKPIG